MSSLLRFKMVDAAINHTAVEVKVPEGRPSDYFGKKVFGRAAMRKYLDKRTYAALLDTMEKRTPLTREVADSIAAGMRQWALEHGADHYTHWFQPLTGGTAEKHDAFAEPDGQGGVLEEFSGKLLVQQEPDASSFPNGGIRNTFEARGYSAWDPTSPAFIVDTTLCIPTVFIAYTGEALDYKVPLLRSLTAIDKAATEVCRYFDKNVEKVFSYLGWEQEYFLVDESLWAVRPDLMLTGRTLMGHESAKNQQLEDHYFGAIPTRVMAFMKDLEYECLKLGIPVKTRHNEVAPSQFELAPVYEEANLANDHNQLLMTIMDKIARRHQFRVLLHEKPFKGINGSGKHNNWSLGTDTGVNLLGPGKTASENLQFITFLVNAISAVYKHNGLLKASIMSATNAHRLGANEAPPAVISIFLGDELTAVLDAIETDSAYVGAEKKKMKLGVDVLPRFIRDTTDRNRTSPFAFTGNKFEFRMLGSSNSIACANIMLNAAVAQSLKLYADELEQAEDFNAALHELIKRTIKAHKRIIFNGNGYDDTWIQEATEKRGLLNLRTTPDAIPEILKPKNIEMLTTQRVYTEAELRSRYEIMLENYCKTVCIEAQTMSDMARKQILPAVAHYAADVARDAAGKQALDPDIRCGYEAKLVKKLTAVAESIDTRVDVLDGAIARFKTLSDVTEGANFIRDEMLSRMTELRVAADEAETLTAESAWPFPTYGDLLFSVK